MGSHETQFTQTPEVFEKFRDEFIAQRLRVPYIVGLVVNPIFIGLDFWAHPEYLRSLLVLRGFLELGLFMGFFSLRL